MATLTQGYSGRTAYELALCADYAYAPERECIQRLLETGFPDVKVYDFASTFSYVADDGKNILIGYRGTADLDDLLSDADIRLIRHGYAAVHAGFWRYTMRTWPQMARRIAGIPSGRQVYFTGHSLGAAACTLAAHRLATVIERDKLAHRVAGVYLYGSPKVGGASFVREYNEMLGDVTFRHWNNNDPVCWVPFKLGTYRHVAVKNLRYFTFDGVRIVNPSLRERLRDSRRGAAMFLAQVAWDAACRWRKCRWSPCRSIRWALLSNLSRFDHYMDCYIELTRRYSDQ